MALEKLAVSKRRQTPPILEPEKREKWKYTKPIERPLRNFDRSAKNRAGWPLRRSGLPRRLRRAGLGDGEKTHFLARRGGNFHAGNFSRNMEMRRAFRPWQMRRNWFHPVSCPSAIDSAGAENKIVCCLNKLGFRWDFRLIYYVS